MESAKKAFITVFDTQYHPEKIHNSVFIAQGAMVVGDVTLAENCSVWFNAVLRGDTDPLSFDAGTNLQDGVICHADPGYPLVVGAGCTVGHRAILHGCRIGANVLVGMGAIILNGAVIGDNSVIGAGALITQHKVFPPNVLILGSPAKVARELTADEITAIQASAIGYQLKAQAFLAAAL